MDRGLARIYLDDIADQFRQLKNLADRSLARLSDEDLRSSLDPESNSIAVLMQHISGNLISRWTDFLTSDGEKPDRNRDGEFVLAPGATRERLMARWEQGWSTLFAALAALGEDDLGRTVTVRGEPHTVPRAIHRQLSHQAYHVGQLVLLAKHLAGPAWQTLTVPRGGSTRWNADMAGRFGAGEPPPAER
jgi:hypothetical protein